MDCSAHNGILTMINHKLKSYNFVPCITETFFLLAFHLLGHIHWQTQKLGPWFYIIINSTIGNLVAFILIVSIIRFHPQTQVETTLRCHIVNSTSQSTAPWVSHLNGHTLGFSPRTQMLLRTFSSAQVLFDCSSAKVKVTLIGVGSFFLEKQGGVDSLIGQTIIFLAYFRGVLEWSARFL